MKQKTKHAKSNKARKGSALLLSAILLFVVLSMVVSLTYVTVMEQKMSQKTKSSVGSFFNAESGVEWALNKIANTSGKIAAVFGAQWKTGGYAACPDSFGGENTCKVYFLDDQGKVITDGTGTDISAVKAVRSVGSQGQETQRAIEAAVAASGDYQLQCMFMAFSASAGVTCCRMDTSTGATTCRFANSSSAAWSPFGVGTLF